MAKKQRQCKREKSTPINALLSYMPRFGRIEARLFDQQMWCWGQDIRSDKGNLLVEYGFTRVPAPDGRHSSRYEFNGFENSVILWGFALWYTHTGIGSLLLKRHDFRPRVNLTCTAAPAIWRPNERLSATYPVTEQEATAAAELSAEVLAFISRYEAWVREHVGLAYRQRVVKAYPHRCRGCTAANEMAATWASLAERCQPLP